MKIFEFPATALSEDAYVSMSETEWYALRGTEVTAIPIDVLGCWSAVLREHCEK